MQDRDPRLRKMRVLVLVPHLLCSSCSEVLIGTWSAQPTRNPLKVAYFVSLNLKTGIEHTLGRRVGVIMSCFQRRNKSCFWIHYIHCHIFMTSLDFSGATYLFIV